MNRIIKAILRGIVLISLLFFGCVAGILVEQNNQKRLESQKEDISTIAIVNMDDGVSLGEEHINYASQLISFPNERFVVTGLNDAKIGIENGYYAAYIVIPETFSVSVTSIENDPRKVILEYQYNSKLDEESRLQAVGDVNEFINLINSNIAYMYVDAILGEFHHIQDDSAAILASDNAELERLQNVDATQLIAAAEPIEETTVDFEVQSVEVSSYTNQNDVLLESLESGYLDAVQKGKDEFMTLQETNVEMETASANFFSVYNEVINGMADERSNLLAIGQDNLKEAVGLYNDNVEDKRQEVENMVSSMMAEQLATNQESTSSQLTEILKNIKSSEVMQKSNVQEDLISQLTACQTAMDEPLENLGSAAYFQGYGDAFEILEERITSWKEENSTKEITADDIETIIADCKTADISPEIDNYSEYVNAVKGPLNDISINWDSYNASQTLSSVEGAEEIDGDGYAIVLPSYDDEIIASNTDELMELFVLQADTDEINNILQTDFVDALLDANHTQMNQLSEVMDVLNQEMGDYQDILVQYDPLKYIEEAGLDMYLSNINGNTIDMMNAIEQNNEEYMSYSIELNQATTDNMIKLRNALNLSNEQTSLNVENCINDLVTSREAINSQNVSMLAAFTDSLRYTRVESIANKEVYDYIINPIVSQRNGQVIATTSRETPVQRDIGQELIILLLGTGIVVCIVEMIRGFLRQYRKRSGETSNVY